MEWIIAAFVVFILVNTFLLIAIAGSLYKLIVLVQTMTEEPIPPTVVNRRTPMGTQYRMVDGEWVQLPNLTYDMAVMRGEEQPFADGLKDRPTNKNWDGVAPQDS
jgi:hypothetical protein